MKRMVDDKFIKNIQDGNLTNIDLKVKTIEQSDYNWESENLTIRDSWLNGLTANNSFVKMILINKVLHIIVSTVITNSTESAITTGANTALLEVLNIPEEITSRIYRKDGTSCDKPYTSYDGIVNLDIKMTSTAGGYASTENAMLYSSEKNTLRLWLASGSTFSVGAGDSAFIDARISIVL